MTFEGLIARLRSSDQAEVASAAEALCELRDPRAFDPLVELVLHAEPTVRNAAALGLRALGDERARDPLLRAIADPATEGSRGTLVYALGGFDCSSIVPELIGLIIHGNFELSRQAFTVLEEIDGMIPTPVWNAAQDEVKRALATADDEKRGLLVELLELFEDGVPSD